MGTIGCGDDSSDPMAPAAYDITGTWSGTWISNEPGYNGMLSASFTQDGNSVSGTATLTDSDCFSAGAVTGTVSADNFSYEFRVGSQTVIKKSGTISDENHMAGTYEVVAGDCTGDEGAWELLRDS